MQKENVHPQNNITKKEIKDNVIYSVEGHGNVVPNANLSCHSSVSSFLGPYSSSTIFLVSPLIQVYVSVCPITNFYDLYLNTNYKKMYTFAAVKKYL